MPLTLQSKLLRVLQEREIERVGGRRRVPIDVRVLAATHANLAARIARGDFREDLYYRLRVVEIALPPLRDRREDIPRLVRYFLDRFAAREGRDAPVLDREAYAALLSHDFPGNIRELENLLEGAAALSQGGTIRREDLQWLPAASDGSRPSRWRPPTGRRSRTCGPWRSATSAVCCAWRAETRAGRRVCSESAAAPSTGSAKWDNRIL